MCPGTGWYSSTPPGSYSLDCFIMYVESLRSPSGGTLDAILEGARKRTSSFGIDTVVKPCLTPGEHQDLLQSSEPEVDKRPPTLRQVHYGFNVMLSLSIIGYICTIYLHDRALRNQILPHVREFEDIAASVNILKARDAQLQLEIERDQQEEARLRAALEAFEVEYEGALQPLREQEAALRAELKAMKKYHSE